MDEIKARVVQAGTPDEDQPVRFSIELSPTVYQNMLNLLAQGSSASRHMG